MTSSEFEERRVVDVLDGSLSPMSSQLPSLLGTLHISPLTSEYSALHPDANSQKVDEPVYPRAQSRFTIHYMKDIQESADSAEAVVKFLATYRILLDPSDVRLVKPPFSGYYRVANHDGRRHVTVELPQMTAEHLENAMIHELTRIPITNEESINTFMTRETGSINPLEMEALMVASRVFLSSTRNISSAYLDLTDGCLVYENNRETYKISKEALLKDSRTLLNIDQIMNRDGRYLYRKYLI